MASVGDFVKDVTPAEAAALEGALGIGEQVRWATRPKRRGGFEEEFLFWFSQFMGGVSMLLSVFFLGVFGHCFTQFRWPALAFMLFFGLLFLVAAMVSIGVPLHRRVDRGHTLYAVTNHRAIVQVPCRWRGWKQRTYPLHEHMLRSRICRPRGGGDLLFAVSQDGYGRGDQGFTHLPDLQLAHRELNAAINAQLDAAESRSGHSR